MPVTVLDESSSVDQVGIRLRRLGQGPEQELIHWFLEELPFQAPRGCRATIFREPRLESGFPDEVAPFV